MPGYPDNFLRGLRKSSDTKKDGVISTEAFDPDVRPDKLRPNGDAETSINWEDNQEAITKTLADYPYGVVRVARQDIDYWIIRRKLANMLFYERNQIPGNPYHGNIVFAAALTPGDKKRTLSFLAVHANLIPATLSD